MTNFEKWWNEEGSAMRPIKDEDVEKFAKRISKIAWNESIYAFWHIDYDAMLAAREQK